MKTWLITGCSSGIGKGIAKAVLESGGIKQLLQQEIKEKSHRYC